MTEGEPRNFDNLAGYLKHFFDGSEERALEAIETELNNNPDATNQQIFGAISDSKGLGKSYASAELQKNEGGLKRTTRRLVYSRRKGRRKG